jgi:hypothetical protein
VAFLLSICCAVLCQKKARLLNPQAPTLDLYVKIAKLVLYPIAATRCMDLLSYDFLSAFDPVAVAAVLCGKEQAARLAAKEWVVLRYTTVPAEADAASIEAIDEYRAARLHLLESFSAQHGLPLRAITEPPAPSDGRCKTYCPCCGAQYTLSDGLCTGCPNMVLQPLGNRQEVDGIKARQDETQGVTLEFPNGRMLGNRRDP